MSFFEKSSFNISDVRSRLTDLNKFLDEKNFSEIKSVKNSFSKLSDSFKTSCPSLDEKEITIIDDINNTIVKVQKQIDKLHDEPIEVNVHEVNTDLLECKDELIQLSTTLNAETSLKNIPAELKEAIQCSENNISKINKKISKFKRKNKINEAIVLTSLAGTIGGIVLLFTPFAFIGIPLLIVSGLSLVVSSLRSQSQTNQIKKSTTKLEQEGSKLELLNTGKDIIEHADILKILLDTRITAMNKKSIETYITALIKFTTYLKIPNSTIYELAKIKGNDSKNIDKLINIKVTIRSCISLSFEEWRKKTIENPVKFTEDLGRFKELISKAIHDAFGK